MATKIMTIKRQYIFLALLTIFILTGCTGTKTSDANDTYKYWAGTNPPPNIELLNGQYWQSAHWTKEYIMYLKFKSTQTWWDSFLKENLISADKDDWKRPSEAPNWFTPSENSIRYGGGDDFDQGSRYFRDTTSGINYIYEIQL